MPVLPRISLNQKIAVSVVFVAAMFMNIMDITIVNVALPTIGHDFNVRAASLDAVAIGYLVSLAVIIVRIARTPRTRLAETPITVRGPLTYAGPGSLGGTRSALRQ